MPTFAELAARRQAQSAPTFAQRHANAVNAVAERLERDIYASACELDASRAWVRETVSVVHEVREIVNRVYVARFTNHPAQDIARGWSAFMGSEMTRAEVIREFGLKASASADEIFAATGYKYDPARRRYYAFHHNGLSCFVLDSVSEAGAIAEAVAKLVRGELRYEGFGQATVGRVVHVAQVVSAQESGQGAALHVFECEGVEGEE